MDLALFMVNFTAAFTGLFVIMDPFVSIPVLLGISKDEPEAVMRSSADQAVAVAGGLIFVFIFFGVLILDSLDITIDALKVGGGIILMLLGLELVLGFSWSKEDEGKHKDVHAAAIIIGTPLITGPGVLTTTIVYVTDYGYAVTVAAAILSIFITWVILRQSYRINKVVGPQVISVISKIMGMLLVAMSIQFIISGLDVLLKLGLGQG
ncbi:MAG: MarC family protein [Methanobacteriota archaeon]